MTTPTPTGFLLVDKPTGWTSHDVVARVRRLLGAKTGHAGTLDPMATGLLVLGVGRSTRLLRFVQRLRKEYLATARLGVATDTLDADGAILSRTPLPVGRAEFEAILGRFLGRIVQVPPMVSARKVGGRRLYALAREGKEVEREARPVEVHHLEVLDFSPCDYPEVSLRVVCGTGTYVRTLVDDMAQALGGHAHLTALRRTRIGSLRVEDAATLEEVGAAVDTGRLAELLLRPAEALRDLAAVRVGADLAGAVRHGAALPVAVLGEDAPDSGLVRILGPDDALLGVFRVEKGRARAEVVVA